MYKLGCVPLSPIDQLLRLTADMTKIADDPTYNQPKPSDSRDSGTNPTPKTKAEPSNNQTRKDGNATSTSTKIESDRPSTDTEGTHNATGIDDPVYSQQPSQASSRLSQVSAHLRSDASDSHVSRPSTRVRPRRKPRKESYQSQLPADYSDILGTVQDLQSIAQDLTPSTRGHDRQRASGKLTARQRIQALCGDAFREIGSVTGTVEWQTSTNNPLSESAKSFIPSNNPQGFAQIAVLNTGHVPAAARKIYLTADDFAIRSGHADGASTGRTLYGEQLALRYKVPVIKLVDGSSGGGSVTTIAKEGYSYLPHVHILGTVTQQLNMGIPNLGAVLGPAIGLGAARVVSTHFSVMAADVGSLFNAGPKVVQGATGEEDLSLQDLGGWRIHCTNGTIDNMAPDEEACFAQLRTVLGYLPDCGALQPPPVLPPDWSNDRADRTDPALRTLIPRRPTRAYNPYTIINSLVDHTSFFEIGAHWGRTTITGLARLSGRPIALLANNPSTNAGALDALGSQKLIRLLRFADIFNLPIVQLIDVPGYAIGTRAERDATMKFGVQLATTYYTTTTPIFSILVRRCYGVAGGIMLDSRVPWTRVAWPSANWGSLPLAGGIEVAHRAELKRIEQEHGVPARAARERELEEMYTRLMNPVRTASRFGVEEIIDPAVTRSVVCRWAEEVYGLPMQERLADRASGKIKPVFT